MALRTRSEPMDAHHSERFLVEAGIQPESAKIHAKTFADNKLSRDSLSMLDKPTLKDLGVSILGEALTILKQGTNTNETAATSTRQLSSVPSARPPTLSLDMSQQQFRKFKIDWDIFLKLTNLDKTKHSMNMYNSADEEVQHCIINTVPNFFDITPDKLLDIVEPIVTTKNHPIVHRLNFSSITQGDSETIANFVVRLKSHAKDCNFSCPSCKDDISEEYIKDQFVRGLNNMSLQTDILAKAGVLNNLEKHIQHAQAFETAINDQTKMSSDLEMAALRTSQYRKSKNLPLSNNLQRQSSQHETPSGYQRQPQYQKVASSIPLCTGCGSNRHSRVERQRLCPAWGQICNFCGKPNHFASVCKLKRQKAAPVRSFNDDCPEEAGALIAHVRFLRNSNSYTTNNVSNNIQELNMTLTPFQCENDPRLPDHIPHTKNTVLNVFPDSGATITLGGPKHLKLMGLSENNLIRCDKTVRAVGGFKLVCKGWVPIKFSIENKSTNEALYICNGIDRLYLSKEACISLSILSQDYPMPMINSIQDKNETSSNLNPKAKCFEPPKKNQKLPMRPKIIPYPPIENNVTKLKQWLVENFADTAFNREAPFPVMSGPPAHIHLKDNPIPKAKHNPIPIPLHFKEKVKELLDKDVERGIISPVPIGTPTNWCSTMVITAKKNGTPRRTIDYQYLNSQCKRETHHTSSPFHLALQVPKGTKKTVLDAVDGYHSVSLDEASQPYTTFITEWGRYQYLRMPQGYLASGDAYTRRYDEIIKDIPRKVKIVDDALLFDYSIEESFFHTFDYLYHCSCNGIVFNESKFQFCMDTVEFGGLQISSTGVSPSRHMLDAIQNFPVPKTITDARSWFGLINQVAWAYSLSPIMLPFRELVKKNYVHMERDY